MKLADLHIHTYYSDGTFSPQEVVEQALRIGLSCIAIADHDTIKGIQPTIEAAREFELEVLQGIELSSEINGKDVHILGYLFDLENRPFIEALDTMQNVRFERMKKMIEKLKELGIDNIEFEEVFKVTKSDALGRPHLAVLLKEKGWVTSVKEAFNKYLADGASVYVPKYEQSPYEAIELIKNAGGVAVLSHPNVTQVDELIPSFVRAGLGGIEVYYPNVSDNIVNYYTNIAKKHNLVITGGSDAHGEAKKNTFIGKVKVPYTVVEKLKESTR